jgi:hypothetical protein
VYLTPRWAIKVPSLRPFGRGGAGVLWSLSRGLQANLSEREFWYEGTPTMRRALAPVVWSLWGVVNVYPRCAPVTPAEARALRAGQLAYPGASPEDNWIVGDEKPANVGWLRVDAENTRLVWLDYDASYNGCPHNPSGRRDEVARAGDEVEP